MSASTAVVLYASVISLSQITSAVPEEAKDKSHHVKGGKGFKNPWDSNLDRTTFQFLVALLGYESFIFKHLPYVVVLSNCSQTMAVWP
jgi:hypothetical protein